MLRFGLPERPGRADLGDDLARPQSGRVDVGDRVLRDPLLLIAGVEDRRAIARPDVVSLTVLRRRVVNLEEELQQVAVRSLRRIEDDLDRLSVCSVLAIRRVRHVAAGVSDPGRDHARLLADQVLHPPAAPTGKHRALGRRCRLLLAPSLATCLYRPRSSPPSRRDCRERAGCWPMTCQYQPTGRGWRRRSFARGADRPNLAVVPDAADAPCIDT